MDSAVLGRCALDLAGEWCFALSAKRGGAFFAPHTRGALYAFSARSAFAEPLGQCRNHDRLERIAFPVHAFSGGGPPSRSHVNALGLSRDIQHQAHRHATVFVWVCKRNGKTINLQYPTFSFILISTLNFLHDSMFYTYTSSSRTPT